MPDSMNTDIRRMVAAIVRNGLRERGELDDLDRFRSEPWAVHLHAETYVVTWADGTVLATIALDTVAAAVGLLHAKRGAPALLN